MNNRLGRKLILSMEAQRKGLIYKLQFDWYQWRYLYMDVGYMELF